MMQLNIIFIAFFTKRCSGWALICDRNTGARKKEITFCYQKQPITPTLLTVIRCSCKKTGALIYDVGSCKKYSISCTFACKNCQGSSCYNSQLLQPDHEADFVSHIKFSLLFLKKNIETRRKLRKRRTRRRRRR